MSGPAADISRAAAQLREIAERLRAPDLADEEAERLAREAADIVTRAGNELDRALRASDPEPRG